MQAQTANFEASEYQPNGPDKLFGVCQAIGEEFGFNPFFLRLALLGGMFFSLPAIVAAYTALGVTVALSRWLFPRPVTGAGTPLAAAEHEDSAETIAGEPELIAA